MERMKKIKVLSLITASLLLLAFVLLILFLSTATPSLAFTILVEIFICLVLAVFFGTWNMLTVFENTQ